MRGREDVEGIQKKDCGGFGGGSSTPPGGWVECLLGIVQLDIPIEVVPPALGCVRQTHRHANRHADGRRPLGPARYPDQVHAGFTRGAPSLLSIAPDAAGDDVLPVLPAAVRHGYDVIERQIGGREGLAAVLTRVLVASVDV